MQVIQKIKQFLLHRSLIPGSSDPGSGNRLRCSRNTYIKNQRNIRIIGSVSLILLLALTAFTLRPVSVSTDFAEATANPATTTLTVETSGNAAVLDITPSSATGTFSSSDTSGTSLAFNVSTNNITGYNLSISHADATTPAPLVNEDLSTSSTTVALESLSSGTSITESEFGTSDYVGRYGYRPSKLNSADNSNYIPAPTTNSTTLNKTSQANITSDNYTIALGANIDYTKSAGTYTNTFILTAVANNVAYTINYLDNTGTGGTTGTDVSNLPATESASEATASSFTLSSTQPTRTGYTFAGWCDGTVTHNSTGTDTCSGATYSAGSAYSFASPSSTSTNVANLYAMWNVKTYSLTLTFAGTGVSSVQVRTAAGTGGTLMGTVSSSGSSVSGLTYGVAYYLYPTYSTGYTLDSWSKTDSAAGSVLSSTTAANPTYKIGDGDGAVTITGKIQSYTIALVKTNATAIVIDGTSYTGSSVTLTYGTHTISGTYASGYEFSSWSTSNSTNLAITSTTSASTSITVHGTATLTLTAKSSKTYIQDFTKAMCSSQASSSAVTVYDKRDEKSYTVRYINGNCWMTQNLRFSGRSIDATNTNINTSKTISWGDLTSGNSYDAARYHNSGNTTNGYWYNYAGASAMTITGSSNSTNATYDICPKNWRLPKSSEFSGITSYSTAFSPVTGGFYSNGSPYSTGYGYWWSATADNATYRYPLSWDGSSLSTGSASRYVGFYVRCIRSS